jgi:hypothetical protein
MNEDFPPENLKLIFIIHSRNSAAAEFQPSLSIVNSPLSIKLGIKFYIKLRSWISIDIQLQLLIYMCLLFVEDSKSETNIN